MEIPTYFDLRFGATVRNPPLVRVDFDSHPHFLLVGSTGSGKTYALLLLLGRIAKHDPSVRICLCDWKNSLAFFRDIPGYQGYTSVLDGIQGIYREFQLRLELGDESRNSQKLFLVIDEYAALINMLSRPIREDLMNKVGQMLAMGRSLGIHVVIAVQKAMQNLFACGGRDQFGCIWLGGNLSKEQKAMLVPSYRNCMTTINGLGEGYLWLDGRGLYRVKVPCVKNPELLYRTIADKLWVPPAPDDGCAGED